jgi:curli biogenesis system outer membrane secretion channel CsgG
MKTTSKILILFVLLCSSTRTYSQCEQYLEKAETLFANKQYSEARVQYKVYKACNTSANVDEQIAKCDRALRSRNKPQQEEPAYLPVQEHQTEQVYVNEPQQYEPQQYNEPYYSPVQERPAMQGDGKVAVMIAPVELNFPQGVNTMAGDESGGGYVGDYVSDVLMEHLLQCDKIQLIDRSVLQTQRDEQSMASSGEIDYNTALQSGKITGAHYLVKITMLKPDVEDVGTGIPVSALVGVADILTEGKFTKIGKVVGVSTDVKITNVKVSINIITRVVDLQTGEILFSSRGTGEAKGKPQIGIDLSDFSKAGFNSGGAFKQTVAGIAIDNAFKQIGPKINRFFDAEINK